MTTASNLAVRVPVLMYHRVGQPTSQTDQRYCVLPPRFTEHMKVLSRHGYRGVSIERLLDWMDGGPPLGESDLVITFDDGFRGVLEHAFPVLNALGWPATVFLVADEIGGTDEWHSATDPEGVRHRLLSSEDIGALKACGWSFHSHTCTHASLTQLDDASLRAELVGSRTALTDLLGERPYCLAYPYGHVDERVEAAVRAAGYRAAFSVQPGFNRRDVNPFRIRRIDVFGFDTPRVLLRKVQLGSNAGGLRQVAAYYWRQLSHGLRLSAERNRRA